MRSRDVWLEVAPAAGIAIEHAGSPWSARRPGGAAVLEAFLRDRDGARLRAARRAREAGERFPMLARRRLRRPCSHSPHELRVESRARRFPRSPAGWHEAHGVDLPARDARQAVEPPAIATSRGTLAGGACVVCPGDDFLAPLSRPDRRLRLTRCKLHMLRAGRLDRRLPRMTAAVMSDLGLVRYRGYAELPEAAALKRRLEAEQGAQLANGVHLIVVQSADGSLVVGDSHHYAPTPDPFAPEAVDELILEEFDAVLGAAATRKCCERWTGTYASAPTGPMLVDRPSDAPCASS